MGSVQEDRQKVEQFHFLEQFHKKQNCSTFLGKIGTVPHFPDHVLEKRNSSTKNGSGTESKSRHHKMWNCPYKIA
jgi:hypothetical protein